MGALRWIGLFTFALGGAFACFQVTTVNIGQKTSLEHQLVGELEPLTEEELLAASVRAAGGAAGGAMSELRQRAIAARRRQLFNRDDIEEHKKMGCLGEALAAQLVSRPCASLGPVQARLRDRIVQEENQDRNAIIDWLVAADPVLTPTDRPEVVAVYRRLLFERSRPGDWMQEAGDTWVQR